MEPFGASPLSLTGDDGLAEAEKAFTEAFDFIEDGRNVTLQVRSALNRLPLASGLWLCLPTCHTTNTGPHAD